MAIAVRRSAAAGFIAGKLARRPVEIKAAAGVLCTAAGFEAMMKGEGMSPALEKEFEKIMEGYHDLVEWGRREVYKIEA